jgi:CHAD domain-containing protein
MTMSAEPIAAPPLVIYLDGLVDQLRLHVASVIDSGLIESVHQARVTTRRLKAASDLLKPLLGGKSRERFNKIQRRVRRRLGSIRDVDVLLKHLEDFQAESSAPAADWMRSQLAPLRTELLAAVEDGTIARLPQKLAPWAKLRDQIIVQINAVDVLLGESVHSQIDAFAARATELAEQKPGVDPHQVRIAGKALRYTLELAAANGHPLDEGVFKSFKKMQDALGTWHDFVVLAEQAMLMSADQMVAHHHLALQRSVLDLAGEALTTAEDELRKFNDLWRERGEQLTLSIRAAFPLSHSIDDATEPKTDHDPDDSTAPEVPDGPH